MKINVILILLLTSNLLFAQNELKVEVEIARQLQNEAKADGRLFLFLNQNPDVEPRTQTWPSAGNYMFAKNFSGLKAKTGIEIKSDDEWIGSANWDLNSVPNGTYYLQVLWDQNTEESTLQGAGNLYSEKQKLVIDKNTKAKVTLNSQIETRKIGDHPLVKVVDIKSNSLSDFWGKEMHVKASILLPSGYQKGKSYPIRYNISGYGGRYDRVNRIVKNEAFMKWWESNEAPQIINVFVDAEGPFGDNYHLDSDNSGPYGHALIKELAPAIEDMYRGESGFKTRFVDGCSTGGWVSLGLQMYYPDFFNGTFSYSPDAIDFENYQLINIYKDENAFVNEHGYLRPIMRDTNGEPMMSMKDFIQYENVLGASNTYLNSGGQFSAHTALYSPKGENGLPKPMFDPKTGVIDHEVAKVWEKYDFKKYAEKNWASLGPKLQGKIYIWMGDMDNFYLNTGTRGFEDFLKETTNPKSDAVIEYSPMKGHCANYDNKKVLLQMKERLKVVE